MARLPVFLIAALFVVNSSAGQSTFPSHFDWRDKLGGLNPVESQSQCGSSWVFPFTVAMEALILREEGFRVKLSEQHILSCNHNNFGCQGGSLEAAANMTVQPGVVLAEYFPYVAKDVPCKSSLPIFAQARGWNYVVNASTQHTVHDLKKAILEHGPVISLVVTGGSFNKYKDGVYEMCDGHGPSNYAVVIVGWSDDDQTWAVRNSWGAHWGEKGYIRMKYGCNRIGEGAMYLNYRIKE